MVVRSPEAQVSLHPMRDILWQLIRPYVICRLVFAAASDTFPKLFVNTDNYVSSPSE